MLHMVKNKFSLRKNVKIYCENLKCGMTYTFFFEGWGEDKRGLT